MKLKEWYIHILLDIVPADCDVNWSVHVLSLSHLCTEFSITMTQNLWEIEIFCFWTETQTHTHAHKVSPTKA